MLSQTQRHPVAGLFSVLLFVNVAAWSSVWAYAPEEQATVGNTQDLAGRDQSAAVDQAAGAASKIHPALTRRLDEAAAGQPVKAWILFTDKGLFTERAEQEALTELAANYSFRASERRANRRTRPGLFDLDDLPVFAAYVSQVAGSGAEVRVTSRWVNGVSVLGTRPQFEQIARLPFVKGIQPVLRGRKILPNDLVERSAGPPSPRTPSRKSAGVFYGESEEQLTQMNLIAVHDLGFTGAGVVVGVLDTGFQRSHVAFNHSTHPVSVVAEYDFIDNDSDTSIEAGDPSGQHSHGTLILGVLGAYKPDALVGAAYDASFILCKTEDVTAEYPAEEDNYVAGLEFIELNGGDMATSSLGYIDWYTQDDLDGLTAVTTIAVNVATANGVHCCTAAGNEGHDTNPSTSHLIAPADALQVFACGAVDNTGAIASFSSDGPSADGRVKPEVLARGVNTRTVDSYSDTDYRGASGTSLSTPLVAGAVACLVQAHPEWTVDQMRDRLLHTADYFAVNSTFDPAYVRGYGIVDAHGALAAMDCNGNGIPDDQDIAHGTSQDGNGNGVPDECECTLIADAPQAEPVVVAKGRYLSIVPGNPGEQTALRVTLADLPAPFESFEGTTMWVGQPADASEVAGKADATSPTFKIAPLRCETLYLDWSTAGVLHVYGDAIVPGALYQVQAINEVCFTGVAGNYSQALSVATSKWGDLVGDCSVTPCTPPEGTVDFEDISSVVDKFKNLDGAPVKARVDMAPDTPDRIVDFVDIPSAVDAFRGRPYPYDGPGACP